MEQETVTREEIADWRPGDRILLSGKLLTGRDAAHKRIGDLIGKGESLPPGVDWTPVDEALTRLRAALTPVVGTEELPVAEAEGRILSAPVLAERSNPPGANSAVDGYGFAFSAIGPGDQHLPLIHGQDGAKFSKRHGALGVQAYREMGFLPQTMRNYLLRLSWSHGDDEIISTEQAIEWFDLDGVGRLLALTPNDEVNSLTTMHFTDEFGRANVYQLPRKSVAKSGDTVPKHFLGHFVNSANVVITMHEPRITVIKVDRFLRTNKVGAKEHVRGAGYRFNGMGYFLEVAVPNLVVVAKVGDLAFVVR